MCKQALYDAIEQNTQDCAAEFREMNDKVQSMVDIVTNEKGEAISFELKGRGRFIWPFKQTRLSLHRGNLDRLKTNLSLMMLVMGLARGSHEKQLLDR